MFIAISEGSISSFDTELKQAVIVPTFACNLSCRFCEYASDRNTNRGELSEKQLETIANLYRPRKVNVMGGEPLLYRHLPRVFELFDKVTVQTNGILVPEKIRLLERAEAVIVSLEGNRKFNDYLRGKGVYNKVMKAVKVLKEHGIKTILRSCVSPQRLHQLEFLVRVARKLEVGLYFYPELGAPILDKQEQLWLFQFLERIGEEVWLDLPNFFCYLGVGGFCAAAESRLGFLPDGSIVPCQWERGLLGRIGDDPSKVWSNARTFVRTMKIPPTECSGCKYEKLCRGGCLTVPYYATCPLSHFTIEKRPETAQANYEKAQKIKILLRGVVTC